MTKLRLFPAFVVGAEHDPVKTSCVDACGCWAETHHIPAGRQRPGLRTGALSRLSAHDGGEAAMGLLGGEEGGGDLSAQEASHPAEAKFRKEQKRVTFVERSRVAETQGRPRQRMACTAVGHRDRPWVANDPAEVPAHWHRRCHMATKARHFTKRISGTTNGPHGCQDFMR